MRFKLGAAWCACLALTTPAIAQVQQPSMSPFGGNEAADSVLPITSYPLGESEAMASKMLVSLRLEQKQRDLCWELGCIVIVNESRSYSVTGFFVQTASADRKLKWSRNQFGFPLLAKRATFRFKTGGPDACDLPARFVLRPPHGKETVTYETRVSLCSSPHRDTLVRIRAVIPEVEVGENEPRP